MSKWEGLKPFLLPNSFQYVDSLLNRYPILFKITRERKGRLGDYRCPSFSKTNRHQITVNGNLNPVQFLITLIHEYAHLLVWVKYQHEVKPHGKEWKNTFIQLMKPLLTNQVFPESILPYLIKHFKNPSASSMRDTQLQQAIRGYYNKNLPLKEKILTVYELELGTHFTLDNKRIFIKGELVRKRFRCEEVGSKNIYLVNALAPVKRIINP